MTIDYNTIIQRASTGIVKIAHGRSEAFRRTNNVASHGDWGIAGPGNLFPSVEELGRQFVDVKDRDYRLAARGPWKDAGSDGRDLGADLSKLPQDQPKSVR